MGPIAHIVLQATLCSAALRAAPETQIAIRVHAVDRTTRLTFDKTFQVERGYDPKKVVEFDVQWAVYRMSVVAPKYRCSANDYLVALPDTTRTVSENLQDGVAPIPKPAMLLAGNAPESFLSAKPTYILLDKRTAACDKPIGDPLPAEINVENDPDGYYAWLTPNASTPRVPTTLALRVTSSTHQYHYVRLPIGVTTEWHGWPQTIQFNISEDMVDALAGKPADTLLCPKLWETSSG